MKDRVVARMAIFNPRSSVLFGLLHVFRSTPGSRALHSTAKIIHTALGVGLKVDAYQYALGGCDQDPILILSLQIFRRLLEGPTRADSGGTWLHQFFGGGVRVCDHRLQTQRAERNTPAIDHDAHVPTRSLDAVRDGA